MITDTIEYKGYKIEIAQDEGPENPFEAWDCEPPLLTFYGGRHSYAKAYNDAPETLREVLHLLPAKTWERGERMAFLKEFLLSDYSLKEVAETVREYGCFFDAVHELLSSSINETPSSWRDACNWFQLAESLLKYADIPCLYEQSTGYSQGDVTLCLVVLTPEWIKTVGVAPEHYESCMTSAIELYSAWAWGDVYGVSEITAPGPLDEDGDETEGEEIEDCSCWGFYGSDHEKSGLMEHARDSIDRHIKEQAEEAENLTAALCSAD